MMNDWDIANAKREACEEARAEGEAKKQREIAKNLLELGAEISMVSKATGMSEEDIKAL